MQVFSSNMTISEYCQQMKERKIIVNHDYQRSGKIWPPSAKSYFIDTLLLGFPIPKIYIYQSTDLKNRQTTKEIVDGQQRSETIFSFCNDEFSISGNSDFSGKKFSNLEEENQTILLDYQLGIDIFVSATPDEIRQTFKRMNSYTVPLNPQEKRYAEYQGKFKWFITDLSNKYAETLKKIGVFTEKQLIRMDDSELLSDVIMTLYQGIERFSDPKLDAFYKKYEDEFPQLMVSDINDKVDNAFLWILKWHQIHNTPIMKSYNFYTLILAVIHHMYDIAKLAETYPVKKKAEFDNNTVLFNLSELAEAFERNSKNKDKGDAIK
jgi:Protein of unknown function DUF262